MSHTDNDGMERSAPRVLVVDDEDAILTFAAHVLEPVGYEVVGASDGTDALRLVDSQGPFDLFVIDMMMPTMSGDELARRLHQRDPDTKILYFTGYSHRVFTARPMLRETEVIVEKPVSVTAFRDAVSLLLFGHTRGPSAGRSPA